MMDGFKVLTLREGIKLNEEFPPYIEAIVGTASFCLNQSPQRGVACTMAPGHPGNVHVHHYGDVDHNLPREHPDYWRVKERWFG